MEYGGHGEIALLYPSAVLLRDLIVGLDEPHRRYSAEANDDLRSHQTHLFAKEVDAGILLCGERIAILGRTAFENVRDINVLALDVNRVKETVEKLTRATDEGSTRKILLLTGCFADEHKVGLSVARAENTIRSRFAKRTPAALAAFSLQRLPSCIYVIH
jgi:hypothetical protein